MRKNEKINVNIYKASHSNNIISSLNKYHVKFIECCLGDLNISNDQKISVIDKIIENLKLRELNGVIK